MPDFTFTSPEGKDYTVTGPEGATKEQAFAILQKQLAGGQNAPAPISEADKLARGLPVKDPGSALPRPAQPEEPSWTQNPWEALKAKVIAPTNNFMDASIRGLAGGTAGFLGGIGGMADVHPDPNSNVKPMDFESHAQEANAETQRLLDLVLGKQSQGSKDMAQSIAEHMPRELEALPGMAGETAALSAAARGARLPPVPGLPKVPGVDAARSFVDKARGAPAAAEAQAARTRALAEADAHATRARDAAAQAVKRSEAAGTEADKAQQFGAAAEKHLENTEKVGSEIERQLLANPRMSKEEIGAMMRAAGTTLRDEKIKARRAAAGYDQATAQDGAKIVPIDSARKVIEAEKESLKNPNLRATLERVNKELQPTGPQAPTILGPDGKPLASTQPQGLTLTQAESLRDYLNDAIAEKSGTAMSAADKSSERALLKIKDALTEEMEKTSPLWKQANKNFRDASRGELDYLTGKGDLAKTLQTDSISGQYMQTEAEVTGHIIAQANKGSPVLEMLAKQNPEVKSAARMYFTGELFGKDVAPTPAVMASFVKNNERSLKQLGLYDEFKDIASAQRARLKTIDEFKQQIKEAGKAQSEAAGRAKAAMSEAEKHQRLASRYSQFQTEIANTPPKELPARIQSLGKALQDDGLISQDQYGQMLRESQGLSTGFADSDKARKTLLKIGGIIGLGAVGHEAARRVLP